MVIIILCSIFFILIVFVLSRILFVKKTTVVDMIDLNPDANQDYLYGYFRLISEELSYPYCAAEDKSKRYF